MECEIQIIFVVLYTETHLKKRDTFYEIWTPNIVRGTTYLEVLKKSNTFYEIQIIFVVLHTETYWKIRCLLWDMEVWERL